MIQPTLYTLEILKWLWKTRKNTDLKIVVERYNIKPQGNSWHFGEKFRKHWNVVECPDFWITLKENV